MVYRWPNCIREAAPLQASRHFRGQLQQSRRRACLQSNRAKPSPGPKAQESPRCRGGECAPLGPGSESPSASAPLGIGPTRKSLLVPRPPPQCQIRRGNAAPGFGLAQGGLLLRAVPPTLMAERMQPRRADPGFGIRRGPALNPSCRNPSITKNPGRPLGRNFFSLAQRNLTKRVVMPASAESGGDYMH